jgi:hypothetical protein
LGVAVSSEGQVLEHLVLALVVVGESQRRVQFT